jgi:hypothetical protein
MADQHDSRQLLRDYPTLYDAANATMQRHSVSELDRFLERAEPAIRRINYNIGPYEDFDGLCHLYERSLNAYSESLLRLHGDHKRHARGVNTLSEIAAAIIPLPRASERAQVLADIARAGFRPMIRERELQYDCRVDSPFLSGAAFTVALVGSMAHMCMVLTDKGVPLTSNAIATLVAGPTMGVFGYGIWRNIRGLIQMPLYTSLQHVHNEIKRIQGELPDETALLGMSQLLNNPDQWYAEQKARIQV